MLACQARKINEERIEEIIGRLREVWKRYPYLRLSQLIGNVYPSGIHDPYHIKDKDFIKDIEEFYFKAAISTTYEANDHDKVD